MALSAATPSALQSEVQEPEAVPVQYLELGANRRIAYRKYEGFRKPTILYVPGFFANMNLRKTVVVEEFARENGYTNVRYDQECVGLSTGNQHTIKFEHWIEDCLAMVGTTCNLKVKMLTDCHFDLVVFR